jgi:hypothetical protein
MPGNAPNGATVDEESPLLGQVAAKNSGAVGAKLRKHLTQNVSRHWADAVLLFGYIITGLLDSSAVFIWGSFVSMQTGELTATLSPRSFTPSPATRD